VAERVPSPPPARPDPWLALRAFTAARIALGRAGGSIPTGPLLEFQLAHARARDAVDRKLDGDTLERTLRDRGWDVLRLHSAAPDRRTFVQRPDLGRILGDQSKAALESRPRAAPDAVLVMSQPLQKAFSPAPVTIAHTISPSREISAQRRRSSCVIS